MRQRERVFEVDSRREFARPKSGTTWLGDPSLGFMWKSFYVLIGRGFAGNVWVGAAPGSRTLVLRRGFLLHVRVLITVCLSLNQESGHA